LRRFGQILGKNGNFVQNRFSLYKKQALFIQYFWRESYRESYRETRESYLA
jgi:hypothetical protein